jgi:hypothetical protein
MGARSVVLVTGSILVISLATVLSAMEIERRQDLKLQRQRDEKSRAAKVLSDHLRAASEEVTQRALTNLANWKQAFLGDEMMAVCYHGHIFNEKTMLYEVTCDIGLKGWMPSARVVCDQDRCTYTEGDAKLPKSPHSPFRRSEASNMDDL